MKRLLPIGFTAEELDRGEHMRFHPVAGEPRVGEVFGRGANCGMADHYDEESHRFVIYGGYDMWASLPRIGDGQQRSVGDLYPEHWNFDPWMGEQLRELPPAIVALLDRLHPMSKIERDPSVSEERKGLLRWWHNTYGGSQDPRDQ